MKNKKSVSKRRKQKMSKTHKHKKTKNTTKKIGGSANNSKGNKNKIENGELNSLYKTKGELESELQVIEGKIYAIDTKQHPDSNKSIHVIKERKLKTLDNIAVLNEQIKEKEAAWVEHADKKLSEIATQGMNNAIRRSKPNHVGVMGGTTLLLIGVVGIVFAVVKTK